MYVKKIQLRVNTSLLIVFSAFNSILSTPMRSINCNYKSTASCHEIYRKSIAMNSHASKTLAETFICSLEKPNYETDVGKILSCSYCAYQSSGAFDMRKHIQSVHSCDCCSYRSGRAGDLKKHMECVHSNNRKHRCENCGQKFKQLSSLYRHQRQVCRSAATVVSASDSY